MLESGLFAVVRNPVGECIAAGGDAQLTKFFIAQQARRWARSQPVSSSAISSRARRRFTGSKAYRTERSGDFVVASRAMQAITGRINNIWDSGAIRANASCIFENSNLLSGVIMAGKSFTQITSDVSSALEKMRKDVPKQCRDFMPFPRPR